MIAWLAVCRSWQDTDPELDGFTVFEVLALC